MNHGIVDVFAYQEALLLEAVFGLVVLTMVWMGFRRWLQHRVRIERLIAEQTAERSAHCVATMERVEERLKAIERLVSDGATQGIQRIDDPSPGSLHASGFKRDEA